MNVWTYWHGPCPDWVRACLRSFHRHCVRSTVTVLSRDAALRLTAGVLDPRWADLPAGTGTDCLRASLLAEHGGWWCDADTAFVRDPYTLKRLTDRGKFLYFPWPTPPDRVCAGYCYSPKGHPVARRWLDYVNSALRHAENVGWGNLGEKCLTPIVRDAPAGTLEIPARLFMPVDVDADWERYFLPGRWETAAAPDTVAFGLNHSRFEAARPDQTAPPWRSSSLFHSLLAAGGAK